MITDLWDAPATLDRAGPAARASAWSSSGRPSPPMASPPSLRNSRRVRPSQYRLSAPGPHKVSMIDPSPIEVRPASVDRVPGPLRDVRLMLNNNIILAGVGQGGRRGGFRLARRRVDAVCSTERGRIVDIWNVLASRRAARSTLGNVRRSGASPGARFGTPSCGEGCRMKSAIHCAFGLGLAGAAV